MIPILFSSSETAFRTQGLGRLLDARRCEVTEERNGQYELVMEYPTDGPLFDQIIPGNYIFATHDDNGDGQPFEIYQTSAPLDGWVTINAWHISYRLNSIVVKPFTAATCAGAIAGLYTNSMNANPFSFTTDKSVTATFKLDTPASVRSVMGGIQGSILDVFGAGEYEFDIWDVKLHQNRGANNGVVLRYGKNIRSLDLQYDASNKFNAVVPYWSNENVVVYVNHPVVRTGATVDRVIALDLSNQFEEQPSLADLEAAAQAYIDASTNYQVKDNLTIDFVPIWQTEEYKDVADAERVKLCDTVTIYYEKWGINATAKVVKVVYNTLLDRYSLIELGEPKTTLSQQIQSDVSGSILNQVPETVKRMVLNNFDKTSYESATGTSGSISVKTWNITEAGVYLICATGYQTTTGYSNSEKSMMATTIGAYHYDSNAQSQGSYTAKAPMTGGGDCCVSAMFQCAAGDTIELKMQQAAGGSGATLTQQTFYVRSSIIRLV